MGSVKTAILLEWIRTFVPPGTRTTFWWTCQITMWANMLYYTIVVIFSAISCVPHKKIGHPTMPGTCFNTKVFFISNATVNWVSDVFILVLPQRVIWTLKMTRQKKIGVSAVFAIGLMYKPLNYPIRTFNDASYSASLVGAGRLTRSVMYYQSNDNLYNVSLVFVWSIAELSVAFLVFCLPAVPKIFSTDSWIKKSSTRLYSWFSIKKTRSSNIFKTDKIVSTRDSSILGTGLTFKAAWSGEPNLQHSRVASHSKVETCAPDAMNDVSDPYVQETWPGAWSYHDPSTSWYEEIPRGL